MKQNKIIIHIKMKINYYLDYIILFSICTQFMLKYYFDIDFIFENY